MTSAEDMPGSAGEIERLRLDKWLWQARFFKSRSLAAQRIGGGGFRINGQPVRKAHQMVRPGDHLTFPRERDILTVEVLALGLRRGPATEAQTLYRDLTPPPAARDEAKQGAPQPNGGRPTKRERRTLARLREPW